MTITDVLMILAIFLGPIVAVQLTRFLDERREIRERKLNVFKTLMATRAYSVSWNHVEALNRIDLEFTKERQVLDAWKAYLDLLSNKTLSPEQWTVRRVDLLVELLQSMALVLKYDFDKTHIKNSAYSPQAHGDIEAQLATLRRYALELLEGIRAIRVKAEPSSE